MHNFPHPFFAKPDNELTESYSFQSCIFDAGLQFFIPFIPRIDKLKCHQLLP